LRTEQVWNKNNRNIENRTSLEHKEQNKSGTWRTQQIWKMENRTNFKKGEQNKSTEIVGT
jgi:hypothetical protein